MIAQLNGRLIEKNPTSLIIDCGGVGYEVSISLNTYSAIGSDEAVRVFTKMIVREDAQLLYGFADTTEREMFNHLISVSGIGPNTAMIMLSSLSRSTQANFVNSTAMANISYKYGEIKEDYSSMSIIVSDDLTILFIFCLNLFFFQFFIKILNFCPISHN